MQSFPVFSILIDETTNVSIIEHMIIYGRYLSNGVAKIRSLRLVALSHATAVTITDALLQFCGKMEFDIWGQVFALGSDGARTKYPT